MFKSPCYKCSKRHLKCHSDCLDYSAYQAEIKKIKAARKREIEADVYSNDKRIDRHIKWLKSQPK